MDPQMEWYIKTSRWIVREVENVGSEIHSFGALEALFRILALKYSSGV
jgi:hypothetical protein